MDQWVGDNQPLAVRCGRGSVTKIGERHPLYDLIRGGIDHRQLRFGLVGCEYLAAIDGKRDPLNLPRDRDHRDRLARIEIQDRHGSRTNICGVSAVAVA